MKIAILAPVHGANFEKARLQLDNYKLYLEHEASVRFYYHISRESGPDLRNDLNLLRASSSYDIQIAEKSQQTSIKTCLNALLELASLARKDSWYPDFILWHSDSDLLFRTGLSEEIKKYDFGIGIQGLEYKTSRWDHAEKMRQDPRLNLFVTDCLGGEVANLRIGRTEGCFIQADIWSQIIIQLKTYFGNAYFDLTSNHWCAEEVLLPSLLKFSKRPNTSCTQQKIHS